MLTTFMKWISACALAALVVSHSFPNFGFALAFIVFGGAMAVAFQASRSASYLWATAFAVIALLFNPVVPVVLPFVLWVVLYFSCLTLFIFSLRLKTSPRMTMASITEIRPPGRSL